MAVVIGLDTNVLIRYLFNDDPEQARLAARFIDEHVRTGGTFRVSPIVLCELGWVLKGAYKLERAEIAGVIDDLLRVKQFSLENCNATFLALSDYRKGKADFADCLLARLNLSADCAFTITFDKAAAGLSGMKLLR